MSGFIGVCLKNGAFLSADTRRTNLETGEIYKEVIKKIYRLNSNIMIATGGLGTVGHMARQMLSDSIKDVTLHIDEIIDIARPIFRQAYENSLITYLNHGQHLYAIFAGYDKRTYSGFIKVINDSDVFEKVLDIDNPGQPYFTGSNSHLVQKVASDYYYSMKENYKKFNLDLWSLCSFKEIIRFERSIGFPIQLCLVKEDKYFEKFPVTMDELYIHDKEFETEFYR